MPKVFVRGKGEVTLTQNHYKATGGQASVYLRSGVAYKLYTDPKSMIPEAKIALLGKITDPHVIRPQDVLVDQKGTAIGYTMLAVEDGAAALCQLFTRAFCERNGIDQPQKIAVARSMGTHLANIHQAGAVVVDENELNILVPPTWDETFWIDVDSYQVPGYPATVIMPSVRDWSVKPTAFSEKSDWFSLAVLAFQLFVAAHPYKGTHKPSESVDKDKRMVYRMRERISAFRKDVRLPAAAYPIDAIPQGYRDWLEAVLERGVRVCPPDPLSGPIPVAAASQPVAAKFGGALVITRLFEFPGEVIDYAEQGSRSLKLVRTQAGLVVFHETMRLCDLPPNLGTVLLAFTPKLGVPVALTLRGTEAELFQLDHQPISLWKGKATEIARSGGRLYTRCGTFVMEVEFGEMPMAIVPTTRTVADVMELASHLYDGCAVQSMMGSAYVSLFPRTRAGYQVRIPDLDGYRVMDAKFEACLAGGTAVGGVLMVVGEKAGRYDRLVLRFDGEFRDYDLRKVENISPAGLNFAVLDSRACVCLNEDEELELFMGRSVPAPSVLKTIQDPGLGSDMRLVSAGGKLGFIRGNTVYQMTMGKP